MTRTRALAGLLALILVLVAACGDDDAASDAETGASTGDDTTEQTSTPDDAPDDDGAGEDDQAPAEGGATGTAVDIADFAYAPDELTVAPGTEVTVSNADDAAHTLTGRESDFGTDSIDGGAEATFTAPEDPGSYEFYCSFHPYMKGTVVVE